MLKIITKRLPSLYIDVPALRPGTVGAYALAFVAVGVATALRVALDPYLVGAQFVTFFPAIVITTLISGFGAGFFCAVLSTASADFFVLEPRWSFNVEDPAAVADLLLFGPLASYCVILIARMRTAVEGYKERVEKQHLLLGEINHRAENMLSVVDAIAHQAATKSPEDLIERFSGRIQALAANHDLLVQNEWKGVAVADLIHTQLAHLADLIGVRIALDGPANLRLNSAACEINGLALHELATNATKYGALSVDGGRIDVSWAVEGDMFTMSWIEHDGPPVSRPERNGFGGTVITSLPELTIGGEVQLEHAPSGTTWRLTCPAVNALEPLRA